MVKECKIYNKTLTTLNTQYSQVIPGGVHPAHGRIKKIEIQCRTSNLIRIAFVTGKVATPTAPYWTIKAGSVYYESDLMADFRIYLASDTSGVVAEIKVWI